MKPGTFMGEIEAVKPKTQKILKILLPTTLPTAKSKSFFDTAAIDVANSGKEVPKAIINADIKNFEIPKIWIKKGHYCFLGELKETE